MTRVPGRLLAALLLALVAVAAVSAGQTGQIVPVPGGAPLSVLVQPASAVTGGGVIGQPLLFTPDGTYSIGAAGANRPLNIFASNNVTAGGSLNAAAGGFIGFTSNTLMEATSPKLWQVVDSGGTTGLELDGGTPALGTCTGGSLTSGSHNSAGEITGNTSGSCILTFGTPNFTNTPFCVLNDETNLVAARVSARSAAAITITGLTSGDAVQYVCLGRIGT